MTWWRHSRFLAFVESKWSNSSEKESLTKDFDPGGEAAQIALRIMKRMRAEVEAGGAVFLVADLPWKTDIEALSRGDSLPHAELRGIIGKDFKTIPLTLPLAKASKGLDLDTCFPHSHYNKEFNAVIGEEITRYILKQCKNHVTSPQY